MASTQNQLRISNQTRQPVQLPFNNLDFYKPNPNRKLGSGTFGEVILGGDGKSVPYTAIKVLKNTGFMTSNILNEITALVGIDSEYVIKPIDVVVQETQINIVFPLANGSFNYNALKNEKLVRHFGIQMCAGVADIHRAGLLHLDIKPDNLLVHETTNLWISDFSISEPSSCLGNKRIGDYFSHWYRPPEIFLGMAPTQKSDVWAVGVILCEMIISQRTKRDFRLFSGVQDLDTLKLIFSILGSPTSETWSEALSSTWNTLGDEFKQFQPRSYTFLSIGGNMTGEEIDLILWMLQLNPDKRPSIFQVLQHAYFRHDMAELKSRLGTAFSIFEPSCRDVLVSLTHQPNIRITLNGAQQRRDICLVYSTIFSISSQLALAIYLLDYLIERKLIVPERDASCYIAAIGVLAANFYNYILDPQLWWPVDENTVIECYYDILKLTEFRLNVTTSYSYLTNLLKFESQEPEFIDRVWYIWELSQYTRYSWTMSPEMLAQEVLFTAHGTPRRQLAQAINSLEPKFHREMWKNVFPNGPFKVPMQTPTVRSGRQLPPLPTQ